MVAQPLAAPFAGPQARDSHPHADRAIYLLWISFCALMMFVAIQDAWGHGSARWWEPVLWEGSSMLAATFWLVLQRKAAYRYDAHLERPVRWFAEHLKWLPLVIATFVPSIYAFRHAVYGLLGERYIHESWTFVFVYESVKLTLFAGLWIGILFGFSSFAGWRNERQRLALLQKSLAEARLSQLKAQLRPHFLFNALNTISALMHADVERADRLLAQLSELLRATLRSGERDRISLRDELHLLELYAQIMQVRFMDRVALAWRIDPEAMSASVPALILQPLLENAFKHGVEKSRERVDIEVSAQIEESQLHLVVRNSGAVQAATDPGLGLRNGQDRLHLMYGDAARLTLSESGGAVTAHAVLPFERHVE